MSAGLATQLGHQAKPSYDQLLNIVAFQALENMQLRQENTSLKQENSQLKQQINSGTTFVKASLDLQPEKKQAGRKKKEVTDERFCDALKTGFRNKSGKIITWIKGKVNLLKKDPSYCMSLSGKKRTMAPLYVTITAGVFTPTNSKDARPVLEGSPLERYFGIANGSYSKYSIPGSFQSGAIHDLAESFQTEVLNSA